MNDSKFSTGLLLGLVLGGGAVFLLGTRTGKNILKIVSEQGLDGITALLEEYGIDNLEEVEEMEEVAEDEIPSVESSPVEIAERKTEKAPKKHFFRRVRK